MEEGRPVEAARHRLAVEFEAGRRATGYYANVKIYSPRVALAMAASSMVTGVVTVGACYRANPEATKAAVKSVFRNFAEVLDIRESSISVELYFHTSRSLLVFMTALEAKIIKQRLQRELSKIGFKDELEVTIVNCKEIYDTLIREDMEKSSSDFEAASDSSGVETMESEEELSQAASPGEPHTRPLRDLEELWAGSTQAYPKRRREMEESSLDFEAASGSSGVETMESEEEFSPQQSAREPLTTPLKSSDLEGEELSEEMTSASAITRREMMKAAAASPSAKVGTPTYDELEELAYDILEQWIALGRRLGLHDLALNKIEKGHERLPEKGYNMLRRWKLERGSAATYEVLNDALRHKFIQRQDLAEKFCLDWGEKLPISGSSKSRRELVKAAATRPSVREGTPSEEDLFELAAQIGSKWRSLARRLDVRDSVVNEIDHSNEALREKGYHMLKYWKGREGVSATYHVLHDALRHELVMRPDLAEEICCD